MLRRWGRHWPEIRVLLRNRSVLSTAIEAKADRDRLRKLAHVRGPARSA